jgi:Tfp pilus assembly protein PilV
MKIRSADSRARHSFSLAEVVLALGVIAIAVTAILALFPVALTTGHSAQDITRAPQIAQDIITSIASQAQSALASSSPSPAPTPSPAIISQPSPSPSFSYSVNLTASSTPSPSATPNFYADNYGNLTQNAAIAIYAIYIFTNPPPGFPTPPPGAYVTVRVAWPANAPAANQTYRDYVRIISGY